MVKVYFHYIIIIIQISVYNKENILNYQKIYNSICDRGQTRILPKEVYTERHHITPKCLGGSDEKGNITKLTAREHFLCHYILAIKLHPNNHKLMYALWAMCKLENKYQNRNISSRNYEHARIIYIKYQSNKMSGSGNPMYQKPVSIETREKLKEKRKLRIGQRAPNFGKVFNDDWKSKMSMKKIKEKNPFYGKQHTNETKLLLREKALTRPPTNCRKIVDDNNVVYNSRKEYMAITKTSEPKMYKLLKMGILKSI